MSWDCNIEGRDMEVMPHTMRHLQASLAELRAQAQRDAEEIARLRGENEGLAFQWGEWEKHAHKTQGALTAAEQRVRALEAALQAVMSEHIHISDHARALAAAALAPPREPS